MKKALKRMAAAALVTLSVLRGGDAFAQNAVDGRVVDANGAPLVGVTVLIKGTQSGTATGANGSYSIKAREDQTLVFSYLGYTTVEEYVGKRTAINVKMTEEASQIGAVEIVNIGYGTTTRRDLTGSVAKADLGTMMKANVTNFDQALGGRIAGVVVTTGDGSLGAEANITYKAEDFDDKGNLVSGVPSFKGNAMQPGDMKYRDMNGDGVIDDYDRTIIGCGQPLNTGGFGNNFNWKNFDLNIFFAWSYGNDVLNANRLVFESGWRSQTNQLASYADRWSPENPASNIPRVNAVGREEYSSRVIEDGSFLRLKNVSLGYTLPSRSLRKAGISQMRVYVSADNIWTLTGYSGPDPEVSTRNSVLTPGFDWSAYPRAFGFTAGVNLTF